MFRDSFYPQTFFWGGNSFNEGKLFERLGIDDYAIFVRDLSAGVGVVKHAWVHSRFYLWIVWHMRRGIVALRLPHWFDRRSVHRAQCVICGWLEDPDLPEEDGEGGFQEFLGFKLEWRWETKSTLARKRWVCDALRQHVQELEGYFCSCCCGVGVTREDLRRSNYPSNYLGRRTL